MISHSYWKQITCLKLISWGTYDFFFSIFNLNPTFVIMKAPKHLPDTTKATSCRIGVEMYHIKMLRGFISYTGQIFFKKNFAFHNPGLY